MFEKIVLATDLSPAWDEVVECVGEFRALGCSQVILTHVITVKFLGGLEAAWRAEALPKLRAQKGRIEAQGLKVAVETPLGLPAYSLNEVARHHGASLLVVGSHGQSLWRESVLGCFACAVLHHTEFPVLLLKVAVAEEKEQGTCRLSCTDLLRHLLFPTDFSGPAALAFEYLEELAAKGANQVTLLHALEEPGVTLESAEAAARDHLQELKERLQKAGAAPVHPQVSRGHPITVILDALKAEDFSLIVMGTQGKGLIREIFLGSVAHNISRLAPCPVLLVPPRQR